MLFLWRARLNTLGFAGQPLRSATTAWKQPQVTQKQMGAAAVQENFIYEKGSRLYLACGLYFADPWSNSQGDCEN